MKRIEFYIGAEKDKHGVLLDADRRYYALEQTRRVLASTYGGFTETVTHGGWKDKNDHVVIMETGFKYDVWIKDRALTRPASVAREIKNLWDQSAVLLVFDGKATFVK